MNNAIIRKGDDFEVKYQNPNIGITLKELGDAFAALGRAVQMSNGLMYAIND